MDDNTILIFQHATRNTPEIKFTVSELANTITNLEFSGQINTDKYRTYCFFLSRRYLFANNRSMFERYKQKFNNSLELKFACN